MNSARQPQQNPPAAVSLQQRNDGTLIYVTGSMGSGKTSWVRRRVAKARRLLVWDGKGIDWGQGQGCTVITHPHALRAVLTRPGRWSYRVPVTRANFETFCRLAWIWGRLVPGVIVVDEVADVTTSAKAPPAWGEIARKARAFGTDVYVTTQRPQECDKTAQGNAMLYHCGLMADADDQAYVARRLLGSMDLLPKVSALLPLQWIERDVRTRQITTGSLKKTRK